MTESKPHLLNRLYLFLADRPIVVVTLAATALLLVLHLRIEQQITGESLGTIYLQLSFTKSNFEAVLASWKSAGIARYLETLWIDYFLALCTALLLSSSAAHFQERHASASPDRSQFIFMLVPFAYMIFEFIENSLHIYILMGRHFSNPVIMTSSIISFIKLVCFSISIGWMMRCYRNFRSSQKKSE